MNGQPSSLKALAAIVWALVGLVGCSQQPSEAKIQALIEQCSSSVPTFSREVRGNSTPQERAAIEAAIAQSEAAAKTSVREMCEKSVRASCASAPDRCR